MRMEKKMPRACLLVVGNEILDGSTADTNSGWVCRQISGRGATVASTLVVADDQDEIVSGLQFLATKEPELIVTLGGLGPTRDDLTLEAVARFAGVETAVDEAALAIVRRRYEELSAEGRISEPDSAAAVQAREKMARIPVGATPLDNAVGAAPAVWIKYEELVLLSLPGVPRELKSVFTEFSGDILQSTLGSGHFGSISLILSSNDESSLAGPLAQFDRQFLELDVYLKSRARRFDAEERMMVTISAKGDSHDDVCNRIALAKTAFLEILDGVGITLLSEQSDE
jgi:nicotinamide-nucleotide amidase